MPDVNLDRETRGMQAEDCMLRGASLMRLPYLARLLKLSIHAIPLNGFCAPT